MRYFGFLLALFVFILIGAVVVLSLNHSTPVSSKALVLSNYAGTDASVSYTINGITNGDDSHRSIKITINNLSRMIEIVSGYQGFVLNSQTTPNNVSAFQAFLSGLQTEGYLLQRKNSASPLGQCPLGNQYVFDTSGIKGATDELWTTTCGTKTGTFAGNLDAVTQMFQLQIPDYSSFVNGVNLN